MEYKLYSQVEYSRNKYKPLPTEMNDQCITFPMSKSFIHLNHKMRFIDVGAAQNL